MLLDSQTMGIKLTMRCKESVVYRGAASSAEAGDFPRVGLRPVCGFRPRRLRYTGQIRPSVWTIGYFNPQHWHCKIARGSDRPRLTINMAAIDRNRRALLKNQMAGTARLSSCLFRRFYDRTHSVVDRLHGLLRTEGLHKWQWSGMWSRSPEEYSRYGRGDQGLTERHVQNP